MATSLLSKGGSLSANEIENEVSCVFCSTTSGNFWVLSCKCFACLTCIFRKAKIAKQKGLEPTCCDLSFQRLVNDLNDAQEKSSGQREGQSDRAKQPTTETNDTTQNNHEDITRRKTANEPTQQTRNKLGNQTPNNNVTQPAEKMPSATITAAGIAGTVGILVGTAAGVYVVYKVADEFEEEIGVNGKAAGVGGAVGGGIVGGAMAAATPVAAAAAGKGGAVIALKALAAGGAGSLGGALIGGAVALGVAAAAKYAGAPDWIIPIPAGGIGGAVGAGVIGVCIGGSLGSAVVAGAAVGALVAGVYQGALWVFKKTKENAYDSLKDYAKDTGKYVIEGTYDCAKKIASAAKDGGKYVIEGTYNCAKKIASAAKDGVKSATENAYNYAKEKASAAKDAVQSAAESTCNYAKENVASAVRNVIDYTYSAWNTFTEYFGWWL